VGKTKDRPSSQKCSDLVGLPDISAIDKFVVVTATFRLLYAKDSMLRLTRGEVGWLDVDPKYSIRPLKSGINFYHVGGN
jgi:hypothetical protein